MKEEQSMINDENIVYDVISYTFHERETIPIGDDNYVDIHFIINLIQSGNHGDIIACSETQYGICISVRNTIGINGNIFVQYTVEWQKKDPAGQYSQYKTLILDVLMGNNIVSGGEN